MRKITRFLILLIYLFYAPQCTDSKSDESPYVIMISIDGFRHDYPELHHAEKIIELAGNGVRAEKLIPAFPSKTFPNHYTLVTGMYPEHHGIVANTFYDPSKNEWYKTSDKTKVTDGSWYGGIPLWVLAEKQGIKSACYFWVGSEAEIDGIRPTYYTTYDGKIDEVSRINQVLDWLKLPEADRPHFITLYFELVDDAGHTYGPESEQTGMAVQKIDSLIGYMYNETTKLNLDLNYILVSDHGMKKIDQNNPIDLSAKLTDTTLTIIPGDAFIMIYTKDSAKIENTYNMLSSGNEDFDIYKKREMPAYLHFNQSYMIGDIILLAHPPRVFGLQGKTPSPGAHGFDPFTNEDMGALFIAWGPAFKSGLEVQPFYNVNVYPLVASVLDLHYDETQIDGRQDSVKNMLR